MMEDSIFPRSAVADELQHFIEARLHSDADDPVLRAQIAELIETVAGTIGQPTYVALDPRDGRELGRYLGAAVTEEHVREFIQFLKQAQTNYGASKN